MIVVTGVDLFPKSTPMIVVLTDGVGGTPGGSEERLHEWCLFEQCCVYKI